MLRAKKRTCYTRKMESEKGGHVTYVRNVNDCERQRCGSKRKQELLRALQEKLEHKTEELQGESEQDNEKIHLNIHTHILRRS